MSSHLNDKISQHEPVAARLATSCWFACFVLAVATVCAYWPVVHADYINYDDTDYVTQNARVQTGLNWTSVNWAFISNHASNWHPLTWLSHMLDVELFGKGATGPHCVNLLLHVLNTLLLFGLLRRITASHWRSLIVAGLFALHPTHVESVAWVSERKDVLSTLFWMLTLICYASYVEKSKSQTRAGWMLYVVTLICYVMGLMSKPMLVTLPFVMLLLDYWPLHRFEISTLKQQPRNVLRLVWEKAPFFLFSTMSCAVTSWAQQKAMQPLDHLHMAERWGNAAVAYARYIGKTFWPANLALPYLHPGHWPVMQLAMATVLVVSLGIVAVMTVRKCPFIFVGWFWYLGTLVPVIGLVQVGTQSMADRYTYVPLIGLFVAVVWGVGEVCIRSLTKSIASIAVGLILIGCVVLTRQQAGYWHDSENLFIHSAEVSENNYIALANVGGSLFERGKLDEAMDYYQQSARINPNYAEVINSIGAVLASKGSDEAVVWFRRALDLQPNLPDALFNMGNALAKKGDCIGAAQYFEEALKNRPDNFEARNNLGNALIKLKKIPEAAAQYQLALSYKPDGAMIHRNLGEALAAQGKLAEAIQHYQRAIALTNDPGTHYSLGLTFAVQGKWDDAIRHYTATIQLSPTNAEAQYNLGYAFQMQRKFDLAAVHLGEAVRLKPEFALAHFNLAAALVENTNSAQAIYHLREAVRLKPDYEEARDKLLKVEVEQVK